jgi:hypothetical protein
VSPPDDAKGRNLIARPFEAALVDRVAYLDVGVSVPVRAHVPRGREAGAQIGLRVLDRDEHRLLGGHVRTSLVEHVGVSIDQPGQDG